MASGMEKIGQEKIKGSKLAETEKGKEGKVMDKATESMTDPKVLEALKLQAKQLEKEGKDKDDEDYVINVLQPKIYMMEQNIAMQNKSAEKAEPTMAEKIAALDARIKKESSGRSKEELQAIVDAGLAASKEKTEKAALARELNDKEIESLRESILKAKGEAVRLNQDATLDWYEGNYDKAKASQDKAQKIEEVLGINNTEKPKQPVEKKSAPVEAKTKKPLSDEERYGEDTMAEVKKIRTEEMQRLVNLRLPRETILRRMADFEKSEIKKILLAEDTTTPTPSYESVAEKMKKKQEEDKKNSFWSKIKPSWWS